jgi:hypothetical protein
MVLNGAAFSPAFVDDTLVLKLYPEPAVFKLIGAEEASTRGIRCCPIPERSRTFPAGPCNEANFNMMDQ